ncbi:MAG: Uma2 family endonuclease [Chamaesiphon sp.]
MKTQEVKPVTSETLLIEPAPLDVALPPTQDELPCCDGIPMETQRHFLQMGLLIDQLMPWLAQREDGFVSGNMFVYFSLAQVRNQDFRGPDFFVALGVPKRERKSWVVWEEGKSLDVVIELLSDSTAERDKTEKKQIYQNQLRVPEYFWFDPFHPEDWAGFALRDGVYEPLGLDTQGRFVSQQLGLTLLQWQGKYQEVEAVWLRWATCEGVLLPTSQEQAEQAEQWAEQAEQWAEQAEQRAEQAEQRAEQLTEQLRMMGIEPESFGNK